MSLSPLDRSCWSTAGYPGSCFVENFGRPWFQHVPSHGSMFSFSKTRGLTNPMISWSFWFKRSTILGCTPFTNIPGWMQMRWSNLILLYQGPGPILRYPSAQRDASKFGLFAMFVDFKSPCLTIKNSPSKNTLLGILNWLELEAYVSLCHNFSTSLIPKVMMDISKLDSIPIQI